VRELELSNLLMLRLLESPRLTGAVKMTGAVTDSGNANP